MNKDNLIKYSGYLLGLAGILMLAGSYFISSMLLFFTGVFILLVSILFTIFLMTIDLYKKDKELNIEALEKAGLNIVACSNCQKDNVLEDQYCVHCGEELKE